MKYKIGDKVVLTVEAHWDSNAIRAIEKLPGRIAIIESLGDPLDIAKWDYYMEGMIWGWRENEIVGLAPEPEITITRFELMEL